MASDPGAQGPSDPPRFDVAGKIALVTGAARGLGRACAIALAQAGADGALGYRDARAGGGTTGAIPAPGPRALPPPMGFTPGPEAPSAAAGSARALARTDLRR